MFFCMRIGNIERIRSIKRETIGNELEDRRIRGSEDCQF